MNDELLWKNVSSYHWFDCHATLKGLSFEILPLHINPISLLVLIGRRSLTDFRKEKIKGLAAEK